MINIYPTSHTGICTCVFSLVFLWKQSLDSLLVQGVWLLQKLCDAFQILSDSGSMKSIPEVRGILATLEVVGVKVLRELGKYCTSRRD